MVTSKAAKRYASALFDLALDRGRLDKVQADMQGLKNMVETCEDFSKFIANPLISTEDRTKVLDKLLRKRIEVITYQFVLLLDEKRRLGLIAEVCVAFEGMVDEHKGILKVRITSAQELQSSQVDAICRALKARFNKDIEAETATDDALIGGFKVQVGNTIYDNCISTRLETFRQQLMKA